MNLIPHLQTERLILRPFVIDDTKALFNIVQEPNIFQYFPTRKAWSLERTDRYINYQIEHWQRHNYGHWAVTVKESGQLMGWCGLEFLPETNETEVGYLLSNTFWGNGFATEAATASVEFGRNELSLQEIIGLTDPQNRASQRVLEKSGFAFTRKQFYFGMEMFRFSTQV